MIKFSYKRINTISQQRKSLWIQEEKLEQSLPKLLKATKELEIEEMMIDKVKKNIKPLDISIDIAHESLTSDFLIFFSALATIAQYTTVAATQAHAS